MNTAPKLVIADSRGNIYDDPDLQMVARRGEEWFVPQKQDLIPLPEESAMFFLPERKAAGFNPLTGEVEMCEENAVAAFAAPGHTLSAHPAYFSSAGAPMLPLFAYGAVGYADGRFWICAKKTDEDPRQIFSGIGKGRIEKNARWLLGNYPENRLLGHIINNCVRRYNCPAARNFALGRYEAPLPTSRTCNSRCLGCISAKSADSPIAQTPQCRLEFVPAIKEIVEVMQIHENRERDRPIYSFGQGCEGDPLMNPELLAGSIEQFRKLAEKGEGGRGTVNCNTNASGPAAVRMLCDAGLTSMRVSLNSSRPELYEAYYRPVNYTFQDVERSIRLARRKNVYVSLNLLFFPGVTDTFEELDALSSLCLKNGVSMIQWRNLNIDPEWYFEEMGSARKNTPSIGLTNFMKALKKACPWLRYGYFNPYLGDHPEIEAPMPSQD